MFSKTWILKSIGDYSQKIDRLKAELQDADTILIGAGSGLSTSAGLTYDGERFLKHFSDFHEKYGITDKATPHKDNIEKYRSEQRKHPRGTPNSVRPVGVIGPEII